MISTDLDTLKVQADDLGERLKACLPSQIKLEVVDGSSMVGGGALPAQTLPSKLVALRSEELSASRLEIYFRDYETPIIGRVERELFLLDVRTLQPGDKEIIVAAAAKLAS
jgi:L-seryl-tRNA(Ser) seleniumtransferase